MDATRRVARAGGVQQRWKPGTSALRTAFSKDHDVAGVASERGNIGLHPAQSVLLVLVRKIGLQEQEPMECEIGASDWECDLETHATHRGVLLLHLGREQEAKRAQAVLSPREGKEGQSAQHRQNGGARTEQQASGPAARRRPCFRSAPACLRRRGWPSPRRSRRRGTTRPRAAWSRAPRRAG